MTTPIKSPRKLIEVALPLDAINAAAAREKSIRHGHPSTLHLWWARRPLAAARAVLFAQLVNDPGYQQGGGFKYGVNKEEAAKERARLFDIIKELVQWENTTNEEVLERARAEIRRSWREVCELNKDHPQAAELFNPEKLPAFHDPFAGGGAIPLEAQRLGLEAYASDLNPVAVLINKAMIEIPPKFAGRPPVNPEARGISTQRAQRRRGAETEEAEEKGAQEESPAHPLTISAATPPQAAQGELIAREWKGAEGLAEDVRYYGRWMRDEAQRRIGHLYPRVRVTAEMAQERPDLLPLVGQELTVIAWLWARTVKSPNPAFSHVDVPLASTFLLSTKEGKEAYVEPVIEGDSYRFTVKVGKAPERAKNGTKVGSSRSDFLCLMSGTPMEFAYLRAEAKQGRMGQRLMAVVVENKEGRIYLPPTSEMEWLAASANPTWTPRVPLPTRALGFRVQEYGMLQWDDLFTARQLAVLATFSELVQEVRSLVQLDSKADSFPDDHLSLEQSGTGVVAYSEAVCVYCALAVDKMADYNSTLVVWSISRDQAKTTFSRQALPMTWDFAEVNVFAEAAGDLATSIDGIVRTIRQLGTQISGVAVAKDAQTQSLSLTKLVSTDPPYYDNIGYADLSDFFYVWLRHSLRSIYTSLFATITVPKAEELVATPFRHGSREAAEAFFMDGMTMAMQRVAILAHPALPVTIYYAFKQSETDDDESGTTLSTGWDTFLEAVIRAGLAISGTWPMRTERSVRSVSLNTNALASSIILVCRKRPADAPVCSRRDFLRELNTVLPEALAEMTRGSEDGVSPVAPVDLSQAIIGPGMAVFSKYSAVLEANGQPMRVRTALQLINRFLAEDDFDADTQFCLHWFEQHGWATGRFGEADTLARAKGTSVEGVRESGVLEAGGGSVRLRKWAEYPAGWRPGSDSRNPVWETLHQLIRSLKAGAGEEEAGRLLSAVRGQGDAVRQLAYRLYTLCERQGWAEDARAYNELITSWTAIEEAAIAAPVTGRDEMQRGLFD